jgi:hypothetical protein
MIFGAYTDLENTVYAQLDDSDEGLSSESKRWIM